MTLSEEWTQGYAVLLSDAHTIADLVEFIISQNRADYPHAVKIANVGRQFQLQPTDAERAIERVAGGILFAAFGDEVEAPDHQHDPIAFASYSIMMNRRRRNDACRAV